MQKSNIQLLDEEIKLESSILNIKTNIVFLSFWISTIKFEAKTLGDASNQIIYKLNKFRQKLIDINRILEELKWKILLFKNQEGKVKSSLCKNTEYKQQENCEILKSEIK